MHCPSAGRKLRVDSLTRSTEFSWGWGPRGWESPWRCYERLYEVVSTCKPEHKSEGLNPLTAGQTAKHTNIPQWSWWSHDHITSACSSEAMKSTQPSGKLGFKPCLCPHLLCELFPTHQTGLKRLPTGAWMPRGQECEPLVQGLAARRCPGNSTSLSSNSCHGENKKRHLRTKCLRAQGLEGTFSYAS